MQKQKCIFACIVWYAHTWLSWCVISWRSFSISSDIWRNCLFWQPCNNNNNNKREKLIVATLFCVCDCLCGIRRRLAYFSLYSVICFALCLFAFSRRNAMSNNNNKQTLKQKRDSLDALWTWRRSCRWVRPCWRRWQAGCCPISEYETTVEREWEKVSIYLCIVIYFECNNNNNKQQLNESS